MHGVGSPDNFPHKCSAYKLNAVTHGPPRLSVTSPMAASRQGRNQEMHCCRLDVRWICAHKATVL
ncbi:hypothetical protein B0H10DRAFT_2027059 [Mycena sp. CBHHK59/15]|nr:hypothetical protein B0H10DRAFT_2027059 [Mycena sp. CBHHK59/15]